MKFINKATFILIISVLFSCGPSQEEMASTMLNNIRSLLESRDTTNALMYIDSIPLKYPKAVYAINSAKNLKNEIVLEILNQKEMLLDSTKMIISELEKNFIKEKTEFDMDTQYIHKRQNFDVRWDKSYIKIHLDETGELYLSSNYHGETALEHTALRVYDDPDQAKTEEIPLDDINNHRSDFLNSVWEKVTYRNGKDNGVIEFIANNIERRLKAVFLGKEYYYIILEDYDKKAVKDAYDLSRAIQKKKELESEIKELQKNFNID